MLCDPVTAWVLARLAEANAHATAEGWGYPGDESETHALRGGPVASHETHTLVFAGSIPAPATTRNAHGAAGRKRTARVGKPYAGRCPDATGANTGRKGGRENA